MRRKKLIVIGAGGHGKAVAEAALLSGLATDIAFIDDVYPRQATAGSWPIANTIAQLSTIDWQGVSALVAE